MVGKSLPTEGESQMSLRQRKKLRTRQRIVDSAIELFTEHGYDSTSINNIAQHADIAARTFFAHFPTKEDILLGDSADQVTWFAAALREQHTGHTVLAKAADLLITLEEHQRRDDWPQVLRLIYDVPALRDRHLRVAKEFEEVIAEALAEELETDHSDPAPHIAAAAFIGALGAFRKEYLNNPVADVEHWILEARSFAEAGLRRSAPVERERRSPD